MSALNDPEILNPAGFVPPSAVAFGAIGSPATAVTPAAPLPVRDPRGPLSLIERLNREGDPIGSFVETSYSSFAAPTGAGTGITGPLGVLAPGRAYFVQSLLIGSTTPISGRAQVGSIGWAGLNANQGLMDIAFTAGPGASTAIPVNAFVRSGDKNGLGGYIKRWLDAAVSGTHYVTYGMTGFTLADSLNFEAEKPLLFVGDSLWNGTGPSDITKAIPWRINRYFREKGVDARYILKAYSGATSTGIETLRKTGKFEFPGLAAIFYQLGTNDAASAVATETSLANAAAFVTWAQALYPEATVVLLGPPPMENNTHEAALALLRTAVSNHVTGLGDPKVLFCDLGAAFDRTVSGNYVGSDTPGSRVHPDDDGLGFIWGGGYGDFAGLEAWLDANLAAV